MVTYHWICSCMTHTLFRSLSSINNRNSSGTARRPIQACQARAILASGSIRFYVGKCSLTASSPIDCHHWSFNSCLLPCNHPLTLRLWSVKKCLDNCTSLLLWTKFWFTLNDAYICQNRWIFREKLWSVFDPSPPRPFFRKIHCNFCWWRNEYI